MYQRIQTFMNEQGGQHNRNALPLSFGKAESFGLAVHSDNIVTQSQ